MLAKTKFFYIALVAELILCFVLRDPEAIKTAYNYVSIVLTIITAILMITNMRDDVRGSDRDEHNSNALTSEERYDRSICKSNAYAVALFIQIAIYFLAPHFFKIASILVFGLSILGGQLYFRIRYGKAIQERMERESREFKEQQKKEEYGKWK